MRVMLVRLEREGIMDQQRVVRGKIMMGIEGALVCLLWLQQITPNW